ncbi:MAG: hypothetical protein M3Z32_10790 [Acidobacteriota bacterium]|nr:hypothetical protein [Acidobacteriota bacterium]
MRFILGLALVLLVGCAAKAPATAERKLTAKIHNSGFPDSHDSYNCISSASDGKIYYVLSSEAFNVAAQMYSFDPATQKIEHLGDLNQASGEKDAKAIAQGKSHVNFVEANGKLYFATHVGYYSIIDGMEKMGIPPAGYKPYPGGHLLAYDMQTRKFEDLAIAPQHEGIITMNMDTARKRIYGLTWPTGRFFRFDLEHRDMKDLGSVAQDGENGTGDRYQTICRSLAIDTRDGSVYFTTSPGNIMGYRLQTDALETVQTDNMRKDYFGLYDPHSAGHMGYNWRQTAWQPRSNMVYGVHGNSGYLFRFDPQAGRMEVLDRITSEPSKRTGMFDQFSYGYLGFKLGPDGETLHYLTGGPVFENGARVAGKASTAKGEAKGVENLHLVTWHIPTGKYADHGPVLLENGARPEYVNSIAIAKDGTVCALARITENGRSRTDLISFPGPLRAALQ